MFLTHMLSDMTPLSKDYDEIRNIYLTKAETGMFLSQIMVQKVRFLTVEELCNNEKPKIQQTNSYLILLKLSSNLIKDKFFEVSKYVTLENSSKKITLKLDAARNAGYDIEYV